MSMFEQQIEEWATDIMSEVDGCMVFPGYTIVYDVALEEVVSVREPSDTDIVLASEHGDDIKYIAMSDLMSALRIIH